MSQSFFDSIAKNAVTSVLKPLGFRKSAMNFHRRHKSVVQVVNLQSSQSSTWNEKRFYVNIGLAFDELCRLTGTKILEKPMEYECDSRGTRSRMEKLVDNVPSQWVANSEGDLDSVTQQLHAAFQHVATELQVIDDVQTYRQHRWFNRFRPKQENAQILYVLGDLDAAWREVQGPCTMFADRNALGRPEWWIAKLAIPKLAPMIDGGRSQ